VEYRYGQRLKSSRFLNNLTAAVILALVTCLLYYNALNAYWRYDDGAHLGFAATYQPWQYFFIPEITRQHNISSVTPWNVLTYDINLRLFGFSPAGFYAHQLFSVWLAGLGTFLLLRLWTVYYWALFGAILFLTGVPTFHIANELMTGHYLEGMILMIAVLYCYVQALRKERFLIALAGAVFYAITVTTKEIYVPLPVFLLFIPEGKFEQKIKYALPYFVCAAAYVLWRYAVLGKIVGGYSVSYAAGFDPVLVAWTFAKIPVLCFGKNTQGILSCLVMAGLISWGLLRKKIFPVPFLVGLFLILVPLMPLAHWPGINLADRYVFLPWWGICCCMAFILPSPSKTILQKGSAALVCAFILLAVVGANLREREFLRSHASLQTEVYRFILNSNNTQVFLRPRIGEEFGYFPIIINGILKADETFNPQYIPRATIISDESALVNVDLSTKTIWRYGEDCKCVKDITSGVPLMLKRLKELKTVHKALKIHYDAPGGFAEKTAGFIDGVSIQGKRVIVVGWANLPYTDAGQTIHVFLSSAPMASSVEIVERPDVAETMQNEALMFSGFRIDLDFENTSGAKRALSEICVAADSVARPLTLLNATKSRCEHLNKGKERQP
jgi:hypothetical protein